MSHLPWYIAGIMDRIIFPNKTNPVASHRIHPLIQKPCPTLILSITPLTLHNSHLITHLTAPQQIPKPLLNSFLPSVAVYLSNPTPRHPSGVMPQDERIRSMLLFFSITRDIRGREFRCASYALAVFLELVK